MINVYDKNGNFTSEFKVLVDNYINEEMKKFTTNGKFDREKAVDYIRNYLKEHEDE